MHFQEENDLIYKAMRVCCAQLLHALVSWNQSWFVWGNGINCFNVLVWVLQRYFATLDTLSNVKRDRHFYGNKFGSLNTGQSLYLKLECMALKAIIDLPAPSLYMLIHSIIRSVIRSLTWDRFLRPRQRPVFPPWNPDSGLTEVYSTAK